VTNSFDEREKAFESKWAHDEELRFKVLARRNRLAGLWAAAEMGFSGARADEYAKAVVEAGLTGKGHDPVFAKIRDDFAAAKTAKPDQMIRQKMTELLAVAGEEISREKKA
jgi:hypothetical protein